VLRGGPDISRRLDPFCWFFLFCGLFGAFQTAFDGVCGRIVVISRRLSVPTTDRSGHQSLYRFAPLPMGQVNVRLTCSIWFFVTPITFSPRSGAGLGL